VPRELEKPAPRPLEWVGSSKSDLCDFPVPVRKAMGHCLHLVQTGETPANAKPLHGFGGASVLELVENFDGNTYRAVYTVKFADAVYVLHAFQKKSKRGGSTPKPEIDLIQQRFKTAAEHYRQIYGSEHA
jgi:phage-related protein